jgi:PhoD-like phosphatase
MPPLSIGPVVGHTDDSSTRIWIYADTDPAEFVLRIGGRSTPFVRTDTTLRVDTGLAIAHGLMPDRQYQYAVIWRSRVLARGSVRTMPREGSFADMPFLVASCSSNDELGVWPLMREVMQRVKPRFLLLIGDQVYQDDRDVWQRHRDGLFRDTDERIAELVETHRQNWSRTDVAAVLANIPTYMMWDDHDIRDGWGSWASDSPTLAERYPRGRRIFERYNKYFEDARHVAWHCQLAHNPWEIPQGSAAAPWQLPLPQPGTRQAHPFVLQMGRLAVLCLDSRGARDVFRENTPILGNEQWQVVENYVAQLPASIDALAVVTTVPIVASGPDALMQQMLGDRDDDVILFERGDYKGIVDLQGADAGPYAALLTPLTAVFSAPSPASRSGIANAGKVIGLREADIDDVRDQWSNHLSLPEQERLIRLAITARDVNRLPSAPRTVFFLGGDLHAGCRFQISASDVVVPTLISSGISKEAGAKAAIGLLVEEAFDVATGISAQLLEYRPDYNCAFSGQVRHRVSVRCETGFAKGSSSCRVSGSGGCGRGRRRR